MAPSTRKSLAIVRWCDFGALGLKLSESKEFLGGRFGYFLFFLLGEGEGGVRGARRGVGGIGSLLKIPGGGGVFQEQEGPGGCLRRIGDFWGGGANIFFFGAETFIKVWVTAQRRLFSEPWQAQVQNFRNDKRPESRGFKKAEIGHGSCAPL